MSAWPRIRGSEQRCRASNVRVERTFDEKLIRQIVMQSWDATCSDGLNKETWRPTMHANIVYLSCITPLGEIVGLVTLVGRTTASYAIPINMLPAGYRKATHKP